MNQERTLIAPQPSPDVIFEYLESQIKFDGDLKKKIQEITNMTIDGNEEFFATLINRYNFTTIEEFADKYLKTLNDQ